MRSMEELQRKYDSITPHHPSELPQRTTQLTARASCVRLSGPMSSPRLTLLLSCSVLAFACACGDSSTGEQPSGEQPTGVPLTWFVPGSPGPDDYVTFASLDYRVSCESDPEGMSPIQSATLEARDAAYGDPERPADVWHAVVDADPGECVVSFEGRDENGEALCVGAHRVTLTEEASPIYLDIGCGYVCAPEFEFPNSDAAPKTTCLPTGSGLVLTAETPSELGAESVRVVIDDVEYLRTTYTPYWDPQEVVLERWWLGMADFGNGPVPTSTWKTQLVVYYPTADIELTALDAEGEPLCQVRTQVDLVWAALNTVHIAMPCEG